MSESLTERWLAALRSGRYQQGRHALRREDDEGEYCHCCLGVLADLIDPTGWTDGDEAFHEDSNVYDWLECGFDDNLPKTILGTVIQSELIGMNDDGKSFAEIAEYIEEHGITAHEAH